MYKLSYYRFADAAMLTTGRRGFDRVRNVEIGNMDIKLNYFTEVFTTEHWMVRIYKVNDRCLLLLPTIIVTNTIWPAHLPTDFLNHHCLLDRS